MSFYSSSSTTKSSSLQRTLLLTGAAAAGLSLHYSDSTYMRGYYQWLVNRLKVSECYVSEERRKRLS